MGLKFLCFTFNSNEYWYTHILFSQSISSKLSKYYTNIRNKIVQNITLLSYQFCRTCCVFLFLILVLGALSCSIMLEGQRHIDFINFQNQIMALILLYYFFLSLTFVFISILLFTVGIVSSASSFLNWKLRSLILNLLPNIRISMYKLLSMHCFRCIPQMLMLKYLVLLSHFPCFVTHGLIVLLNSQVFDFPYICYCY